MSPILENFKTRKNFRPPIFSKPKTGHTPLLRSLFKLPKMGSKVCLERGRTFSKNMPLFFHLEYPHFKISFQSFKNGIKSAFWKILVFWMEKSAHFLWYLLIFSWIKFESWKCLSFSIWSILILRSLFKVSKMGSKVRFDEILLSKIWKKCEKSVKKHTKNLRVENVSLFWFGVSSF